MFRFLALIPLFLVLFALQVVGQQPQTRPDFQNNTDGADLRKQEAARFEFAAKHPRAAAAIDDRFDVTHYDLHLRITTDTPNVIGKVTMKAKSLVAGLSTIYVDLAEEMIVDSVLAGGVKVTFTHPGDTLNVALDRDYAEGEYFSITTFYSGYPANTGFGAFSFADHDSIPWVYTLSEPYYARNWWPCKDYPTDKADSSDVTVTTDSIMKVGSNGVLVSRVNNGDGTATTHWSGHYPIASYLIGVTFTNFVEFTNWFKYSETDSMPVVNYVLPARLAAAETSLALTVDMLRLYSNLYGLYPFIKEKYGHAMFGWGGGMEHQTMTSTSTFSEIVICHELSHQWFGDKVTCGSWHDIWLNEGFASYSEAVWVEHRYGVPTYNSFMRNKMATAMKATQSVGGVDTVDIRTLFNPYSTYAKGGTVLHMLRHILGDSVFFRGMRSYDSDPRYAYKTAVTADFMHAMEDVSGKDLGYFFNEWVYRVGQPTYHMTTSVDSGAASFTLHVHIDQQLTVENPDKYIMPVDLRISTMTGDTVVTVWNDSASQTFSFMFPGRPISVVFDPDNWIMKGADATTGVTTASGVPATFYLERNYPQPFNPTTNIRFGVAKAGQVTLKVYSLLGKEVATLVDEVRMAGDYTAAWNAENMPSGVYFCRLQSGNSLLTKKLLLVR